MDRRQERSHRLRDLLAYSAIGSSLAALAILIGVHLAKTGQKPENLIKWIGFAVMTLLVFGWAIRAFRSFWTNAKFWRLMVLFVMIHVALGVLLLLRTTIVSLLPFMVVTPLEYILLSACLLRFLIQVE
jgi:hypothetical protein